MSPSLDRYRSVQASTADPGQLLVMLMDGSLREMQRARTAFESGESGGEVALMTACLAISELDRTLNYEPLPDLASSLHKLYLHLLWLLGEALTNRSPEPVARAQYLLGQLRDTWREALVGYSQAVGERKAG